VVDPDDWEKQADAVAAELGQEVDSLKTTWPGPGESFRPFWTRVKELNERIRTAPAIKLDDKLELHQRVNELCHKARGEQRERIEQQQALEARVADGLLLASESLAEARTISGIQEVRADLALLRSQIELASFQLRRSGLWDRWQELNRAAWERLNELWSENESVLVTILDEAATKAERGDARGAKEAVKRFHATSSELECSHRGLRSMRTRAHEVWKKADEVGREKHARYLEQAAGRVERWRQAQARRHRQRASIEHDLAVLQRELDRASTGVGQALLRGQIEERRKALAALESEEQDLQRQIEDTEREISGG
jgi:chromosome segregation ATPase